MSEGRKDDRGKLRFDLIPVLPLMLLADVYTRGARKYEARNWEKGIQYSRIIRALLSHAYKWIGGETYDQEDGQHHLSSVVWCCFALQEYEETHPEMDDRPEGQGWILHQDRESGDGPAETAESTSVVARARELARTALAEPTPLTQQFPSTPSGFRTTPDGVRII